MGLGHGQREGHDCGGGLPQEAKGSQVKRMQKAANRYREKHGARAGALYMLCMHFHALTVCVRSFYS